MAIGPEAVTSGLPSNIAQEPVLNPVLADEFRQLLSSQDSSVSRVGLPRYARAPQSAQTGQTQTDAGSPTRQEGWRWNWFWRLSPIGVGVWVAEELGNLPQPIKGVATDYFPPDLALQVYEEGQSGPNGETAAFLKRNANGGYDILPVHVERTAASIRPGQTLKDLVQFDLAELRRAYEANCRKALSSGLPFLSH